MYKDIIKKPSDPTVWKIGTSSKLFDQLTVKELEECFADGVRNIEVCLFGEGFEDAGGETETNFRKLAEAAREIGLTVWSVHLPFGSTWDISTPDIALRKEILEKNTRMLQLGTLFHPVKAVIHPSYEPIAPEKREEHINACRDSLGILSQQAQTLGIQLAVECLPRTCIGNSSAEILRLLEGNPLLGVCCDTNHLLKETTEEFIRVIGDRIVTTHASDYDRIDERHWLPGLGVNNWNEIIGNLAEAGYRGPIMFEVSRKKVGERISPKDLALCWDKLLNAYIHHNHSGFA